MKNFHHKATISVLGFAALFLMTVGLVTHSGTKESAVVASPASISYSYDRTDQRRAASFSKENQALQKKITHLQKQIKETKEELSDYGVQPATPSKQSSQAGTNLANLDYTGQDVITVDNNQPSFSEADLSLANGAWQSYGNLDQYNRPGAANAMLNQSLMPTVKREALTVDPTGWHNKRVNGQWLYNRSHLIGYQLTGQNNNFKNLITGTRQLNDPDMLKYEDEVAAYLKQSPDHYVRYRVTPIFRGNELLARGVEMEAQAVGSDAVKFHVYIFNVQPGVTLNYNDGTSQVN
ncbi:hydroxyacid dehydrogenase [Limosilactobacillus fermentum]|nr:hydroxyacid dehydrogenase [Limosilactobacillus fermentum]